MQMNEISPLALEEIYSKSEYKLANDLMSWYRGGESGAPIFEVAKRHFLANRAQLNHPLIKEKREGVIRKGILEIDALVSQLRSKSHIDVCEIYILIAKNELLVPKAYRDEDLEEVFLSGLRYIAYNKVDYWAPTIYDLKEADETIIMVYKDYYEKLLKV